MLLTFSEVKRIEQSRCFLVICETRTYSLLPCAISVWQTTFLILHVALLGNCKTFQRLPIYQFFKRQLNNVICIWAIEYVNIDCGVIGGMLSAGLTRAAFLQGCCSSAGKCYHQIWPLAEHWYPMVLPLALSRGFSPCFWIHWEVSALPLEQCKPSQVLILPHTLPNPQYTDPRLAAALRWAVHTSALTKGCLHVSYVLG